MISTLIVLVLGICFTFLISHLIVQPLKVAVSHARRIADGDLSRNVDVEGSDEPAQLSAATQAGQALGRITAAVSTIQQMNQQIATAAEEQTAVAEDINTQCIQHP